jgi:hypothetical protein
MRELEGLSYREIGERLGMSRPSVESTLFRARRRLTEEYDELVSGARCQRIQAIIAGAAAADLGARDQRRLARHVSHCQPCRRQARLAGLEVAVTPDKPLRQRVAAVLPLPFFLRRRWSADPTSATSVDTSHLTGFAQWSAQLGTAVDPGWLKAAATAATVALAGAGAGFAGHASTPTGPAGSFSQLVSGLGASDGPGSGDALVARTTPGAAAALADGRADTVATSPTTASTVAGTTTSASSGSAAAPSAGGAGTSDSAAAPSGADDAAAGVGQVAQTLSGSDSPGLGGPSSASNAQGSAPSALPDPGVKAPTAPPASVPAGANVQAPAPPTASVPVQTTPSAPPAPGTPDVPDPAGGLGLGGH